MALVYVGDATFVDDDPVDVEEHAPREWSPRVKKLPIYWYVEFPSMERVAYGLALLESGPKSKWIDSEKVGEHGFSEPIAPLWEFDDALKELEKEGKKGYSFEEHPFVEVANEEDYLKAVAASLGEEFPQGPREWSPGLKERLKDESHWEGPGVYDFRDLTRSEKSVEDYEKGSMEFWGDDALEMAYDSEWENALRELVERNVA